MTGIGIDKKKRQWVLPVYDIDCQLVGFEYRPPDFKKFPDFKDKEGNTVEGPKCRKEPLTPSIIAIVAELFPSEILVVIEGFIDAYLFLQHCIEKDLHGYHIATPSNGVGTTLAGLRQIDTSKYKQVVIYLDNDKAGKENTEKILKEFPKFIPQVYTCGCSDFNEHYLNCIKQRSK